MSHEYYYTNTPNQLPLPISLSRGVYGIMDLHSGMMYLGMQRARTASGDLSSFKVAFGESAWGRMEEENKEGAIILWSCAQSSRRCRVLLAAPVLLFKFLFFFLL